MVNVPELFKTVLKKQDLAALTIGVMPHSIERVEDLSNPESGVRRARIHFKNGYSLSIIQGSFTYGSNLNLFEIAIFNKDGFMDGELFDEIDQGDDVLGYCDIDKVNHYIIKVSQLGD